eukprot:7623332-Alexandrium_andersonii.AAC.1
MSLVLNSSTRNMLATSIRRPDSQGKHEQGRPFESQLANGFGGCQSRGLRLATWRLRPASATRKSW